MPIDPNKPESWHFQIGITQNGLRVAACGHGYQPTKLVDVRPFEEVPSLAICEACDNAYRRLLGLEVGASN
jgi:hypothetical protein